jgi:hypothetical protein
MITTMAGGGGTKGGKREILKFSTTLQEKENF